MLRVLVVSIAALALSCSSGDDEPPASASTALPTVAGSAVGNTPGENANSEVLVDEIKVPVMDSRRHLESEDEAHEPYNSVPATSGPHYPIWWREWGVADEELPDELVIHNMEHGGVIVRYDCPEGCPELHSQLAGVTLLYQKVILSPYSDMGTKIALTAWGYLDKFDEFDEDRIVRFIDAHMNSRESPEPLVFP